MRHHRESNPTTFWLEAQCLNQLRYRVPPTTLCRFIKTCVRNLCASVSKKSGKCVIYYFEADRPSLYVKRHCYVPMHYK